MSNDIFQKILKAIRALGTRRITIVCDRIAYPFNNVPFKKILNWILVEASIFVKPKRPWGWPTHLQVEPTTFCNLRCALCPVTEGLNRPTGHMNPNLFKKLIDETGDYLFLILLWDWREPFVNPEIYEMISYAKKKGIKVVSSSNGHLFTEQEKADQLIESGIDSLIFAIDGITQETYQPYRHGGNLETVLRSVRMIAQRKRDLNSATPFINFRFIAMGHNEHEIPRLRDFVKPLGADAITIKTLNTNSNDSYIAKREVNDRHGQNFLPKNVKYQRFNYRDDGKTPKRMENNPCKNAWNAPTVHWDGTICLCTYDYDDKYVLGNLKTASLKEIWTGPQYRKFRHQFRSNWNKIPICANCSYAYEGGNCGSESIAEAFSLNPENQNPMNSQCYVVE